MSPPDSAPLETLSLAELRELVGTLVAKVADLGAANAALKAENQALRDEVARVKGLPPRPPSRPSGMEQVLAAVKTRVLMALTCRWMLVDVKLAGIVAARLRGWCRRARGRPGRYAPPAAVPCGHP